MGERREQQFHIRDRVDHGRDLVFVRRRDGVP